MNLLQIKLVNRFILLSDWDLFSFKVSEPKKGKDFSIQEQMDIPAQEDTNEET